MTGKTFLHIAAMIGFIIFTFSAVIAFFRLFIGRYNSQRIVALDYMASISIGSIACFAVWRNNAIYLNVILALALAILLGTIAYAHYLQSRIYYKEKDSA